MIQISFLFVYTLLALLSSSTTSSLPLNATLVDYAYGNNGCPQGSPPTLRFDVVNATAGTYTLTAYLHTLLATPSLATYGQTSCTTAINFRTDAGYRLRVNRRGSEVKGWIGIADNTTTAQVRTAYDWIGQDYTKISVGSLWFTGPIRGPFDKQTPVEGGDVLSECGSGFLRENFQVRFNHTKGAKGYSYVPQDPKTERYEYVVATDIEVVEC